MQTLKNNIMKKFFISIVFLTCISILFLQCQKDSNGTEAYAPSQGGQGGSLARFTIVGNYMYTVDEENLSVFDITDAANPLLKRTIKVGFEIETIFPFKDKLFIGSTSVVHIFSIIDPANPTKLSTAISPTVMRRCDPVVAKQNVAYATLRTNGMCGGIQSVLAVFDISDVMKPVQKTTVPVNEPYGLGYKNNTLYVCDKSGLSVYNITNEFNPVFVKSLDNSNWYIDVIPYNDILICWTSTGVKLYDILNNQNPVLIISIN